MNSQIELLVSGLSGSTAIGLIDLHSDEPITINMAIADIKDIKSRKSTFSESFVIPGTKNNNELFNYLFEIGINSKFNPSKKTPCQLLVDTLPVINNGYLQLTGINVDDEKKISYEVSIFDEQDDFATVLGTQELTDLQFSGFNHTWNATNVQNSWTGSSQPYFYGLIDYGYDLNMTGLNTGNGLGFDSIFPSTQAKVILDAIFSAAGYSYTSNFLTSQYFKNLYIPYNGSPAIAQSQSFITGSSFNVQMTGQTASTITVGALYIFQDALIQFSQKTPLPNFDNGNLFNSTTHKYTSNMNSVQTFIVDLDYQISGTSGSGLSGVQNRINFYRSSYLGGTQPFQEIADIGPISSTARTQSQYSTPPLNQSTSVVLYPVQSGETFWATLTSWIPTLDIVGSGTCTQTLFSASTSFSNIVSPQLVLNQLLDYNVFIPKKIKQIDFLTSIITMHNLYLVPNKLNPKNFTIEPRDVYYSGGSILDWSTKLDLEVPVQEILLSEQTNKRIVFSYTSDSDFYNDNYHTSTNKIFGDQYTIIDNDFLAPDDLNINILFAPTPSVAVLDSNVFSISAQTANDFVIPKIGKVDSNNHFGSTDFKIRILQKNSGNTITLSTGETWRLGTSVLASPYVLLNNYPYLGMLDHPSNPVNDIAFGEVDYEYYNLPNITDNNLVNKYWANYLQQLIDANSKLITCNVYLTPADIQAFQFSNTIFIDGLASDGMGGYFLINNITYSPTANKSSQVELIQVTNKFIPVTKSSIRAKPTGPIQVINLAGGFTQSTGTITIGPAVSVAQKSFGTVAVGNQLSVYGGSSNSVVFGIGNTVQAGSPRSFLMGSGSTVSAGTTGAMVFGDGITASTSNTLYANNIIISSGGTINNISITTLVSGSTLWSGDSLGNILANNGSGNVASNATGFAYAEGEGSTSTGEGSHAEGISEASGNFSHAEGQSLATGNSAHAEGNSTTASGNGSHAEGLFTTASGTTAHAEGNLTQAFGSESHAEGQSTKASGQGSHAEGNACLALGTASHAEGATTTASGTTAHSEGNLTTALGNFSHAEGNGSVSVGTASHAEGLSTQSIGNDSHSEGNSTLATGLASHAEGFNTAAAGNYSHAGGNTSIANNYAEWARTGDGSGFGQYGIIDWRLQTPGALATEAFVGDSATRFAIQANFVYKVKLYVIIADSLGNGKEFEGSGIIKQVGGTVSLVGSFTLTSTNGDAALATASLTATADNVNKALKITVTGIAATTINWYVKGEYERTGF